MAVNGAAAKLVPPSTPASPSTGETAIGIATADAVTVFYQAAIAQQERGLLPPAIKDAGASRIAALALMQLGHELGDDDFFRRAHEQGKCELHRLLSDTGLFQCYAPGEVDTVLDTSISDVLGIVGRVVEDERIFRRAWAN